MAWSAIVRPTAQDYITEGLPGLQTVDNPTANPPTRATQDLGKAIGQRVLGQAIGVQFAVMDTSGTSGLTSTAALKKMNPAVF